MNWQHSKPEEIEKESMRIIASELAEQGIQIPKEHQGVVYRAIHTAADFDFAKTLVFTPDAVEKGVQALQAGCPIVTDTNMALSGMNKGACAKLGVEKFCYMADPQVAQTAKEMGTTRAVASVDVWAEKHPTGIFVVGNAPTALIRMAELIEQKKLRPTLVVGVPVGFVNVVESKEWIWNLCQSRGIPAIVALGRKGGSTIAAAICNALLYQASGRVI